MRPRPEPAARRPGGIPAPPGPPRRRSSHPAPAGVRARPASYAGRLECRRARPRPPVTAADPAQDAVAVPVSAQVRNEARPRGWGCCEGRGGSGLGAVLVPG